MLRITQMLKKLTWGCCLICVALALHAELPQHPQGVVPPGDMFEWPELATGVGSPAIYEYSREAGPDETVFLVGTNLTEKLLVRGSHPDHPEGAPVKVQVQLATPSSLAVTISDKAYDGLMVLSVKNGAGFSAPVVLNAPQPWWCGPDIAEPGDVVRIFGRNLSRRPDFRRAYICLCSEGQVAQWLEVLETGKYALAARLPSKLKSGVYSIWVHAGHGGMWGWGGPLQLRICEKKRFKREKRISPDADNSLAVQQAVDAISRKGGGIVRLSAGRYPFSGTLRVPANVTVVGAGQDKTFLDLQRSPLAAFPRIAMTGWGLSPAAVHSQGDSMTYEIDVPEAGLWQVWLRYGTNMAPWNQKGVSKKMALQIGDGSQALLDNLPNTGGFGIYRWSRSAAIKLDAGPQNMVWRNLKGGGISIDAFVLTRSSDAVPSDEPWPTNTAECLVIQGESCVKFKCKDGRLPGGDRSAVWLAGNGASLSDLTVLGNAQVNRGISIQPPEKTAWVTGCRVEQVTVADCEGKQAENCALYVHNLHGGVIRSNELWGRTPIFLSGTRQSVYAENRLVSVTRYGGNSEAAILGRNEPIEECIIENNLVASPPGSTAGGPTARRLIWFSTGHGSISRNWLAGNGVEQEGDAGQPRFGGVAGSEQNVGEMILFEGNHRTMFFGALADANMQSVTLPQTLPATPDDRLGSVKREQLAHDADGNETPYWPPDLDDGTGEPPISEYYVTVFAGPGQGQTRRVTGRVRERLLLDHPWRVKPQAGSVVAVGTAFYQNLIVGNHTSDGMTGIQLWISCIENVVSGNTIARQRKPGIFLYANGTTLASSMPRTWNRGISPLFWNLAEGNRTDTCSEGALVTCGDSGGLPIEFPRALGNVLRHNSFVSSRGNGVNITSRKRTKTEGDSAASIMGTIVEFNVVRDAPVAYHMGHGSSGSVLRRNHAYFWDAGITSPVAFQVDDQDAIYTVNANTVEGPSGNNTRLITELKKSWERK